MNTAETSPIWVNVHSLVVLGMLGSFTAAAMRLGVSKSAVSLRISELERLAGVSLVQRTTRAVRLTEAGQRLVSMTKGAFEQIEHSFLDIRDTRAEPRGIVRVTAGVAVGRQEIAPRLSGFLRRYPEISVELELSDQLLSIAQEGFDLAIRHTSFAPETHVAWKLRASTAVLVAAPSYVERNGAVEHPIDLHRRNCLCYFRRGEQALWTFKSKDGEERQSVRVIGTLSANNSEVLREAAIQGLGIALLPDFSAKFDLAGGRLISLLEQWEPVGPFGASLYAIHPYSAYTSRPVRLLVEFLREEFSQTTAQDRRGAPVLAAAPSPPASHPSTSRASTASGSAVRRNRA